MTPTDFRLIVICPTISILTLYQSQSLDVLFHCSNVSLNFTYKHKFSTFYCQRQVFYASFLFLDQRPAEQPRPYTHHKDNIENRERYNN